MTRRRALVGLVLLAVLAVLGGMTVVQGTRTNPVVATITVGPNPGADAGQIAVDTQTGRAFVTTPSLPGVIGRTVSVLDTSAGTLLRTVTVGSNPTRVAVDTRSGHVFVGNADDGTVSMLDARTGVVLRTVAVGRPLGVMAVDATTARLFVPNPGQGTVSVLNTQNGALDATINVGGQPQQAAVDVEGGHVFITNGDGHVVLLDTRSGAIRGTVRVTAGPAGPDMMTLTVSQRTARVFVADPVGGTVTMLDAHKGVHLRTVAVGIYPATLAVDERTGRVFVGNRRSHTVSMLDTRTGAMVRTVAVGTVPMDLTVDPRTGQVLVTTSGPMDVVPAGPSVYLGTPTGDGRVVVVDGHSGAILRTIVVGVLPVTTAVDARIDRAFVLNSNTGPSGGPVATIRPRNGSWLQSLKRLLPWLPITLSQPRPPHGSVTVLKISDG